MKFEILFSNSIYELKNIFIKVIFQYLLSCFIQENISKIYLENMTNYIE